MSHSFRDWLLAQVRAVLNRPASLPLLLWCDPAGEWLGLLHEAAADNVFDLWADPAEHELLLRDRFYHAPRAPRVVWLPRARDAITWFEVFALQADAVWEKSLLQALREYGVSIPRDQEVALVSLLPAHAQEWFDKPQETWKELTPGAAKGALVDDRRMLQVLAGGPGEFARLVQEERFAIFARRAVEDFGLPNPTDRKETAWRVVATARLLCTEAAAASPHHLPGEKAQIIPAGLPRDRALKLLKDWQANVYHIPAFENLAVRADATVGLAYWARNLDVPPASFASRAVEETLFRQMAERLDRIEDVDTLAQELERLAQTVKQREAGFWGTLAADRVGWGHLAHLAEMAGLLIENDRAESSWQTAQDAVRWYDNRGWQLDRVGESLFEEQPDLPAQLHRIRARLRRAYLRATDRLGSAFSRLLAHHADQVLALPTAGERILAELGECSPSARSLAPTALIYLDACRLDMGYRLAELLNAGEPAQRAAVSIARAPVPSITALGMAFALPMRREQLRVEFSADRHTFQVKAAGFNGDLAQAEQRRKWLVAQWQVKHFWSIADVLDSAPDGAPNGDMFKQMGKLPRLIVVYGSEFDVTGHEGQLQITGAADHLDRYARAVRRLREMGFSRIIVSTDHGFFHWQPEKDEIEEVKPEGDLLWACRRAMVGQRLIHPTAIHLPVTQSDLEVMVPRSVNAFKTYGGLGFFHGGAMLQEIIVPVVVVQWPAQATRVKVVLKPVVHITSKAPRVGVEAGFAGMTLFGPDDKQMSRRVMIKVRHPATGRLVFKHTDPVVVEPGGPTSIVQLQIVESCPNLPRGATLLVEVIDADDEEILAREEITLGIDIDEW